MRVLEQLHLNIAHVSENIIAKIYFLRNCLLFIELRQKIPPEGLEPSTHGLRDCSMYRFQNSQAITLTLYKIYTYEIERRVFLRGKLDRYAAQSVEFDDTKTGTLVDLDCV